MQPRSLPVVVEEASASILDMLCIEFVLLRNNVYMHLDAKHVAFRAVTVAAGCYGLHGGLHGIMMLM